MASQSSAGMAGAYGNDQTDPNVLAMFATSDVVAKVGQMMKKPVTSITPISYQSQVVNGTNYKVKATVRVADKNISVLIVAFKPTQPSNSTVEISSANEMNTTVQPGLNISDHAEGQAHSNMNMKYNTDLATRQIQVNDWSYNNKMDTLFVFQVMFMSLLFVGILLILRNQGYIMDNFVWYSMAVILVIDVVIIINRSVYTNTRRDTRFWNKKRFQEDNSRESPLARGDEDYQKYIDSIRSAYGASKSECNCPTPKCAPANC